MGKDVSAAIEVMEVVIISVLVLCMMLSLLTEDYVVAIISLSALVIFITGD